MSAANTRVRPKRTERDHLADHASRKLSSRPTASRPLTSSVPETKQTLPAAEKHELTLLDQMLGRFSDALALVETAYSALGNEDETAIAAKVLALRHGIDALKGVYTEQRFGTPARVNR